MTDCPKCGGGPGNYYGCACPKPMTATEIRELQARADRSLTMRRWDIELMALKKFTDWLLKALTQPEAPRLPDIKTEAPKLTRRWP